MWQFMWHERGGCTHIHLPYPKPSRNGRPFLSSVNILCGIVKNVEFVVKIQSSEGIFLEVVVLMQTGKTGYLMGESFGLLTSITRLAYLCLYAANCPHIYQDIL